MHTNEPVAVARTVAHLPTTRPDRLARLSTASVCCLAVTWVLVVMFAPASFLPARLGDSSVPYRAGIAILAGQDPFATINFRYWPVFATLMAPFALLPQSIEARLWTILCTGLAEIGLVLLWRQRSAAGEGSSWRWLLAVALAPPVLILFFLGQYSGMLFGAYAIGLTLLRRHPVTAGLCFAAVAGKPHMALLVVPALLAAAPSATVAFGIGVLFWPIGSVIVAGPDRLIEYLLRMYAVRDSNISLVTLPFASLLPLTGVVHLVLQVGFTALLMVWYAVLLALRLFRGRVARPATVDAVEAAAVGLLPYALIADALFLVPLLLRLGTRPGQPARLAVSLWWILPIVSAATAAFGGGGIAALIGPIAILAAQRERLWGSPPRLWVQDPAPAGLTRRAATDVEAPLPAPGSRFSQPLARLIRARTRQ